MNLDNEHQWLVTHRKKCQDIMYLLGSRKHHVTSNIYNNNNIKFKPESHQFSKSINLLKTQKRECVEQPIEMQKKRRKEERIY